VIHGSVEGSVLFGGVTVGRGTTIRNSVILPFNRIGEDVRIENSLVLEGKDRNIESGSRIGDGNGGKNADHPLVIKGGLTVVGESVNIPPRSRIGSGCLVYGRLEHGKPEQVRTPLDVRDGETFHP
jgi:glucose-1-phosphate adenylyltransferase